MMSIRRRNKTTTIPFLIARNKQQLQFHCFGSFCSMMEDGEGYTDRDTGSSYEESVHQAENGVALEDSDKYIIEALDDDPEEYVHQNENDDDDETDGPSLRDDVNDEQTNHDAKRSRKNNLSLSASFFKRRFVGETSGSLIASQTISGDSVDEILRSLWTIVKPMICREVIFVMEKGNQIPTWGESDTTYDDMGKFIYMQNHQNRRRVDISQISSKLLISWRGKVIRVHVHIYSTAVFCKQLWDLVDKQLVKFHQTDRAGAPSNQSLSQLADELRELHGKHFTGHASSWKLWANYIHTTPAHERERKKTELPPLSIIKFFRSVPTSEAVQLECSRQGLSVATTINDAFAAELSTLEEEADQIISLGQRLKHRISALRTRSSINSSLVSAFQEAHRPEENEISCSLVDNISDMVDVDHM
ncbi:uncharacterized protein LOC134227565 isoform X2 [Armigeres subalbatus]|uniref:uncharacterized protein LOC134227565 isoform X2 n=1 Tax=Armigeres subalbatus TaxID=124917 RepID=UPI002ED62BA6